MLEMGVVLPMGEQKIKARTGACGVGLFGRHRSTVFGYILEKFRSEVVVEGGQLLVTKCSHILFSLYCYYLNRQ